MLKHIIKYEGRLLRADGVAGITLIIFLGAMAYAGWMGMAYTNDVAAESQVYVQKHAERMSEMQQEARAIEEEMTRDDISLDTYTWGPRSAYSVGSSQGSLIAYPEAPLAAFAIGQSDLLPAVFKVSVAGVQPAGQTATLENPFKLLVGHFDFAFVFLYIYPLFIIALTFGLTSGERESGLLRIILAQPLKLSSLALGKVIVRALLLAGIVFMGTGLFAWFVGGDAVFGSWIMWMVVSLLYGGFWMGLAVFIDSRVRSSSMSALALTGCWLVLAVVLPALISFFATALYPVPSRMEYITAMRTETNVARQQGAASLARFFEDHPEIAPVTDEDANFAMLRIAQQEQIAEQLAPLETAFSEQLQKQQKFISNMSYLSPTVLVHQSYLHIAGTGSTRYVQFRDELADFQEIWKAHMIPKYFADVAFRAAEYDRLPAYSDESRHTGISLGSLALPMTFTCLVAALLFSLGFIGYSKRELLD
ncbi:MAG: DUF3526 domain-containing protein [Bacteroidota bacterium]